MATGRVWIHRALSSAGGPGPGALAAGPGPGGPTHGVRGSLLGAGGGSPCHLGLQERWPDCQVPAQGLFQVRVSLSVLVGETPRTVQHLHVDVRLLQGNRPHRMSAHGLRDVSKELSPVVLEAASPGEPAVEAPACRPAGSIPRKSQSYFQSKDGEKARVSAPGRQEEQPFLRGVSAALFCSGPLRRKGCLFRLPDSGVNQPPQSPQSCLTPCPRCGLADWLRTTIAPSQGPVRVHEAGGVQMPCRSGRWGRDP